MNIEKPSVPLTLGMTSFLDRNPSLAKSVANNLDGLQGLLTQIQRDIVTPENRDSVGATVLAIKNVSDILELVAAKGLAVIAVEKKQP